MASLAAAKRISQATFDETVRECVDDLEMSKEEALADAIEQFRSQGVDLSNIDTSGVDRRAQREALAGAVRTLDAVRGPAEAVDVTACAAAIGQLRAAVTGSTGSTVKVNRSVLSMDGGPFLLAACLPFDELREPALDTLAVLCCDDCQEAKDAFPSGPGMSALSRLLRDVGTNAGAAALACKCCRAVQLLCTKTESNKSAFVKKEVRGVEHLLAVLQAHREDVGVIVAVSRALKAVCVFDDLRKDFSAAYDTARAAVEAGFVRELLGAAHRCHEDTGALAAVLAALRATACNDEAVQQISAGRGTDVAVECLRAHAADAKLCRQAAALMRNLCGNDDVKTTFCQSAALPLLLDAVNRHVGDAPLAEHTLATLAAMALRRPTNVERIVACGGVRAIALALRRFPKFEPLQRQGCLAVRNLAGRNPELRDRLLEDDMEALLRAAGTLPTVVDAAYAALRDLKLEVEMVTLDAQGRLQRGVEAFGQVKSNFQPVYDEAPGLSSAMEAAAQSPAALGYNMP